MFFFCVFVDVVRNRQERIITWTNALHGRRRKNTEAWQMSRDGW